MELELNVRLTRPNLETGWTRGRGHLVPGQYHDRVPVNFQWFQSTNSIKYQGPRGRACACTCEPTPSFIGTPLLLYYFVLIIYKYIKTKEIK